MSLDNFSRYVSKTYPLLSGDEFHAKVMELYIKPIFIIGVWEGLDADRNKYEGEPSADDKSFNRLSK